MPRFSRKVRLPQRRRRDLRPAAGDAGTLGISIARVEPGEVDLSMPYSADFTQQNGFVHAGIITAGLDNACGIAAFTLMPSGSDILTVEFKTNLLAPAKGDRFAFRAHVVKPGRTLTVCEARAFANRQHRDPDCHHDRNLDGAAASRLRRASNCPWPVIDERVPGRFRCADINCSFAITPS